MEQLLKRLHIRYVNVDGGLEVPCISKHVILLNWASVADAFGTKVRSSWVQGHGDDLKNRSESYWVLVGYFRLMFDQMWLRACETDKAHEHQKLRRMWPWAPLGQTVCHNSQLVPAALQDTAWQAFRSCFTQSHHARKGDYHYFIWTDSWTTKNSHDALAKICSSYCHSRSRVVKYWLLTCESLGQPEERLPWPGLPPLRSFWLLKGKNYNLWYHNIGQSASLLVSELQSLQFLIW